MAQSFEDGLQRVTAKDIRAGVSFEEYPVNIDSLEEVAKRAETGEASRKEIENTIATLKGFQKPDLLAGSIDDPIIGETIERLERSLYQLDVPPQEE